MRKFFEEVTLLGQPFVKDPDTTVEKLLKQAGAQVRRFARVEVGEGIEKRTENFAEEVMAQVRKDGFEVTIAGRSRSGSPSFAPL